MSRQKVNVFLCILCVFMFTPGMVAWACQIPVFRYGLERWEADTYEIVVLHEGPLDASQQRLVQLLKDAQSDSPQPANLSVSLRAADQVKSEQLLEAWNQHPHPSGVLLTVWFPEAAEEVPDRLLHAGELEESVVLGF